jgi:hypothetical protein
VSDHNTGLSWQNPIADSQSGHGQATVRSHCRNQVSIDPGEARPGRLPVGFTPQPPATEPEPGCLGERGSVGAWDESLTACLQPTFVFVVRCADGGGPRTKEEESKLPAPPGQSSISHRRAGDEGGGREGKGGEGSITIAIAIAWNYQPAQDAITCIHTSYMPYRTSTTAGLQPPRK